MANSKGAPNNKLPNREIEKQIVDKILGEGYDKRIRPSGMPPNKTLGEVKGKYAWVRRFLSIQSTQSTQGSPLIDSNRNYTNNRGPGRGSSQHSDQEHLED